MGLPSLELDSKLLESWQVELRSAGYRVVEEQNPNDPSQVEKRVVEKPVAERGFLVQQSDSWVRILQAEWVETGEARLVAMTHQKGSSAELAKRVFAHLSGVAPDQEE